MRDGSSPRTSSGHNTPCTCINSSKESGLLGDPVIDTEARRLYQSCKHSVWDLDSGGSGGNGFSERLSSLKLSRYDLQVGALVLGGEPCA